MLAAAPCERAAEQRARMAVLAAVGHLSGAERVEDAIDGLADALVPAVADVCWVDLDEPDGERRRLFEHPGDAPPPNAAPARPRHGRDPAARRAGHARPEHHRSGTYDADDQAFFEILAGRVALVLANARLVTDLRSTRARLDGILGALAEAVTVHDDRGQTVYANAGRGDAARHSHARRRHAGHARRARRALRDHHGGRRRRSHSSDFPGRRLVKGESAPELLTRSIDRQTGQGYWLLTKATLLHDQGRDFAVNIIEDVTEAKDAELRQRFLAAGRPAARLQPRLRDRRCSASPTSPSPGWPTGARSTCPTAAGRSSRSRSPTPTRPRSRMAHELRRRFPPDPDADGGVPGGPRAAAPPSSSARSPTSCSSRRSPTPSSSQAIRALGMRSVMIVPMRVGEETLGALTLVTADSGRRFSDADFAFAQDLALRAATAVQNARLYEEQAPRRAHAAGEPAARAPAARSPAGRGAAAYQAGEPGAEVGGDFYDIVRPHGGRHLVFLGDVTGKGIAAAALTSLVRHSRPHRRALRSAPRARSSRSSTRSWSSSRGSRRSRSSAR